MLFIVDSRRVVFFCSFFFCQQKMRLSLILLSTIKKLRRNQLVGIRKNQLVGYCSKEPRIHQNVHRYGNSVPSDGILFQLYYKSTNWFGLFVSFCITVEAGHRVCSAHIVSYINPKLCCIVQLKWTIFIDRIIGKIIIIKWNKFTHSHIRTPGAYDQPHTDRVTLFKGSIWK